MKKLFLLILIIIGTWYVFFYEKEVKVETDNRPPTTGDNTAFRPDPSTAQFSGIEGEVTQLNYKAYGDLNSDEKQDVAVLLAETGGASGVFIYAAVYVSGPVNYKGSNAIYLGDRIAPQNISISNGVVTIKYLDRREDEPFAAEPTVSVSKQFVYKNGELVER